MGIIGSADGPTSIFVSSSVHPVIVCIIVVGVAVAAVALFFNFRKKKK